MIDEHDVREMLHRRADAISASPVSLPAAVRRARRRLVRTAAAGFLAAGVLAVGASVGIDTIRSAPRPADRPAPSPVEPTPSSVDRVGFIGLPPEGAIPSTPERGELVLRFYGGAARGGPGTEIWVYADGRLIWQQEAGLPYGANSRFTGYLEQRLTPEGAELMRSEALSTGLFETGLFEKNLALDPDIGAGPCRSISVIDVRNGDRLVRLTYVVKVRCGQLVMGELQPATREQAAAVARLDRRLADPASWLPEYAWKDQEIRAYVPSRYAICGGGYDPSIPPEAEPPQVTTSEIVDQLPGPVKALIHADGRVIPTGWGPCYEVTTEEARAIVRALDDAGIERELVTGFDYTFDTPELRWEQGIVSFQAILPHGKMVGER
jgi:hypothetical protein